MSAQKAYMGDGVYVKVSEGVLVLTTGLPSGILNTRIRTGSELPLLG
jgi:hypothetical protein